MTRSKVSFSREIAIRRETSAVPGTKREDRDAKASDRADVAEAVTRVLPSDDDDDDDVEDGRKKAEVEERELRAGCEVASMKLPRVLEGEREGFMSLDAESSDVDDEESGNNVRFDDEVD